VDPAGFLQEFPKLLGTALNASRFMNLLDLDSTYLFAVASSAVAALAECLKQIAGLPAGQDNSLVVLAGAAGGAVAVRYKDRLNESGARELALFYEKAQNHLRTR
jgi:hypothetical protein